MTNIIVNKTQHNAILVTAYQNTQCFQRTLRCVSRKCVYAHLVFLQLHTPYNVLKLLLSFT
jgi:hypothetical protein